MSGNGRHAAALRSPIVQPLRLYSIPTGCTRSRTVIRRLKLIGYAFSRDRLSPVSLTRHVHTGAFSRWEPPIGTKYRALAEPHFGSLYEIVEHVSRTNPLITGAAGVD